MVYSDSTRTTKTTNIPYPIMYNSVAYITGWYNHTAKTYVIRVGSQYANKTDAYVTLEYTKK